MATAPGSVSLGGRRVPLTRPRMRTVDSSGELPVASYELFSSTEVMGRMALERMLGGLSTCRYPVGLEPVGVRTERAATATSRSAVSRRFVAQTETALAELLAADLSRLDLVALMVDGAHFGEHCCIVALGIDIDGAKHPLCNAHQARERIRAGIRQGRRWVVDADIKGFFDNLDQDLLVALRRRVSDRRVVNLVRALAACRESANATATVSPAWPSSPD